MFQLATSQFNAADGRTEERLRIVIERFVAVGLAEVDGVFPGQDVTVDQPVGDLVVLHKIDGPLPEMKAQAEHVGTKSISDIIVEVDFVRPVVAGELIRREWSAAEAGVCAASSPMSAIEALQLDAGLTSIEELARVVTTF